MRTQLARVLWHHLESIHAVTYFSAECRAAPKALDLGGFWEGYFACRAAPMGATSAGVVEATFYNFHPRRIRRAIPGAWATAPPSVVLEARATGAAAALRRLVGDAGAERVAASTLPRLRAAIEHADGGGRPLFAANRDVTPPDDPVAALWQATTSLREHRGDGHVALLAASEIDGCEAHVLFSATEGVAPELYLESRGWTTEDWAAASDRLAGRGLVDGTGRATPAGRALRHEVEQRTDHLAARAYDGLDVTALEQLLDEVRPASIRAATDLVFPNPMGLPPAVVEPA